MIHEPDHVEQSKASKLVFCIRSGITNVIVVICSSFSSSITRREFSSNVQLTQLMKTNTQLAMFNLKFSELKSLWLMLDLVQFVFNHVPVAMTFKVVSQRFLFQSRFNASTNNLLNGTGTWRIAQVDKNQFNNWFWSSKVSLSFS